MNDNEYHRRKFSKNSKNIKYFRIKPSDTTCICYGNSKDLILNFQVEY
jgi:hypothetical protein